MSEELYYIDILYFAFSKKLSITNTPNYNISYKMVPLVEDYTIVNL